MYAADKLEIMKEKAGRQCVGTIMMIRPCCFGYNVDAAESNTFMHEEDKESSKINAMAQVEFDNVVSVLRAEGVEVFVFQDTPSPYTPDSIFPNNWFDTDSQGMAVLYPMCPENRRLERGKNFLESLVDFGFTLNKYTDLTPYEKQGKFLEGTGSLVFDCINRVAYACLSPRTHPDLLPEFEKLTGYTSVKFYAYDKDGKAVYHTNVVMSVGDEFAVVCGESIRNEEERRYVFKSLEDTGRTVIEITLEQMGNFCGNILQIKNVQGKSLIVMSDAAYENFTPEQIEILGRHGKIIHMSIPTIEYYGGGSVRCMIAEIFLPRVRTHQKIRSVENVPVGKPISKASQNPLPA